MWSILALGLAERLINQFIDLDAITRIQFNALQGQTLRVVIQSPQLSVDTFFDEGKIRLNATPTGQSHTTSIFEQRPFDEVEQISEATTTLQVNNLIELSKLLFAEEIGNIPVQGDFRLLQQLQKIIQQIEPDLAAHLSPWIGSTLAHEIGKIQTASKHLKRSVSSQLFFLQDSIKEDLNILASRWKMNELNQDIRHLNQNLDRAEAKIQQLHIKIDALNSTQN